MDKYFLPYKYCLKLKQLGYKGESIAYYSRDGFGGLHFIENEDLISNDNLNKPSMYGDYCLAILWLDFSVYITYTLGIDNEYHIKQPSNATMDYLLGQIKNI